MFFPGLPVLGGAENETLLGSSRIVGQTSSFTLFRTGPWLLGVATQPLLPCLETATHRLYGELLQATHGLHLARIWNYVPAINEPDASGLENYRVFCRARALAFEQHFGANFHAYLPSASAVGCKSAALTVIFAASTTKPRHLENPRQIPAYRYPAEYGPRSPSFARATVVHGPERDTVFISGTAAIIGHATIAPHSTAQQLDCVLENLRAISLACNLGPILQTNASHTRQFKVYLRHPADQPFVATFLNERLFCHTDHVSYLHADICRLPLSVEIEATLF